MCMTLEAFEQKVAEGLTILPARVRKHISNIAVLVEDEPSEEDRRAQHLREDETLLGLYKGVPLSERGEHYGIGATLPDTITLYRLPILEAAKEDGYPPEVVIADTILHEFAHHFGMDESEVHAWEAARGIGHARVVCCPHDHGEQYKTQ